MESLNNRLSDVPIIPPPSSRSSQRSRSSSPSKPSDAQYRGGHLRRANIFVDDEIPFDVSQYADTNVFHDILSDDNDKLHPISEKLWKKSTELVKKPSGEAEWTEALHAAIDEMRIEGIEVVHWREDLKPPVHNPRSTIPRKRNQSHQTLHETTADGTVYPSSHSLRAMEQQPIPIFKLKDPRPDICVGLSDDYLAKALEPSKGRSTARSFLYDLQDTSTLISDPHITPLGLRFRFLIVEAKAGATGGNLYQAQNQAAVAGSTAVQIFETLSDLHCAQTLDQEYAGNIGGSNISVQHPTGVMLHLAFSITTEGPIHELWLHFRRPGEEDFYMGCRGTWRTTLKESSLDFLRHLSAVLRWGNSILKDNIISALQGL
ncbi:hypothetical protein KXX50_004320 [Aspergillus fumigatus]|nr:hypothetical protein KXX50_004320 [Aspergillus fumigatus]KAH2652805.1 hypothetical protein KXV32_003828 [Aspergillus fumigatus]KAH3191580.1 hypothetical protein KXW62_006820 [Aspergillus fumigatus]KAH3522921.1 hypothetical protein KXV55_004169 [Aspergillus fumigatus]